MSITSEDGIRLVGHLLTSPSESNQWLIYAHGLGGGWKNGLGIARHFSQRGYGVLMIEMRAQGESDGTIMGAGHLERRDLVEWCQQLVSRAGEDCRITLMGSSMGASAAIEASAEKDLPQQVKAIVSDSAYADFWNEAIFAMGSMGAQGKALPAHPLLDLARLMFRGRKGGYDIADASAVAAIAHSRVPVLLIHAEDDQLVPPFTPSAWPRPQVATPLAMATRFSRFPRQATAAPPWQIPSSTIRLSSASSKSTAPSRTPDGTRRGSRTRATPTPVTASTPHRKRRPSRHQTRREGRPLLDPMWCQPATSRTRPQGRWRQG